MKRVILVLGLAICCLISFSQIKGSFTDARDGKDYKTVKIGNQTWLAENLAYKPNNGNCWAYDNDLNNVSKFGYLYDWETAKIVCPASWHLPSDEEWTILTDYLGGISVAGGKLKSTDGWESPNIDATNGSNFTVLPAGDRSSDGVFGNLSVAALFWSGTPGSNEGALVRYLVYGYGKINSIDVKRTEGKSIRCVKD